MSARKPAYVIAEVEVTDPAVFQEYLAQAIPSLAPYNARLIVRGRPEAKEGAPSAGEIVIVVFNSLADAREWYDTPGYGAAIKLRQRSANTRLLIVEGEPL